MRSTPDTGRGTAPGVREALPFRRDLRLYRERAAHERELRLQPDAAVRLDSVADARDQPEHVGGGRATRVEDEVRVPPRDDRAAEAPAALRNTHPALRPAARTG